VRLVGSIGLRVFDHLCTRIMEASTILGDNIRRASLTKEGPIQVLSFISITRAAAPMVIEVLERWSQPTGKSSHAFLNHNPTVPQPLRALSAAGSSNDPYKSPEAERVVYEAIRALFPPREMLHHHYALDRAIRRPNDREELSKARAEILKTWDPNPTILVSGTRAINRKLNNTFLGGPSEHPRSRT
jgi:hypothetical protein